MLCYKKQYAFAWSVSALDKKRTTDKRGIVQALWTLLTNSYATGFLNGVIYQGNTKSVCVPGLNCYSCPGARGACPIGSLQAVIGGKAGRFPFYVLGTLLVFGALLGRFICGWLCPFGWVQDLLFKLPPKKKWRSLKGEAYLRKLRYVVLVLFVIVLPVFAHGPFGMATPWFCKYICPSGTLFGALPLLALNDGLRNVLGWLFTWKAFLLVSILALSVKLYRPFCRYLCPLGAFYGVMNPVSLLRMEVDAQKCTTCGVCQRACELDVPVFKTPNAPDCIRCGKCVHACPHGALRMSLGSAQKSQSAAFNKF